MKRDKSVKVILYFSLLSVICFMLFACDNPFNSPNKSVADGCGTLSINFVGGEARTVFPSKIFDTAKFTFTNINDDDDIVEKEFAKDDTLTIDLAAGISWKVAVNVYIKENDVDVLVATGSAITPIISATDPNNVEVILTEAPQDVNGSGTFTYTINFPAGATVETLELEDLPGFNFGQWLDPVETATSVSGSVDLVQQGFYLFTVKLIKDDWKEAGLTRVVHIYDKLATEFTYTFGEDEFFDPDYVINLKDFGPTDDIIYKKVNSKAELEAYYNSITGTGNYVIKLTDNIDFGDTQFDLDDNNEPANGFIFSLRGGGNTFTTSEGIFVDSGETLILRDITINFSNSYCFVACRTNDSKLIMEDGSVITGGSGVIVRETGVFTMYDGKIHDTGDAGNNFGYGVLVSDDGTFIMNGGKIYDNYGEYGGGVTIWNANARFVRNGGSINDNENGMSVGQQVLVLDNDTNKTILAYRDSDVNEDAVLAITINADGDGIASEQGTWEKPDPYIITASGANFTATKDGQNLEDDDGDPIGVNVDIQDAIDAIRAHAKGADVTIKFNGTPLDIGTASIAFIHGSVYNWGAINLEGGVTSTNADVDSPTILISDNVSVTITGGIANSGGGNAVYNGSTGEIVLDGNPTITGSIFRNDPAAPLSLTYRFDGSKTYTLDYTNYIDAIGSVAVTGGAAYINNFELVHPAFLLEVSGSDLVVADNRAEGDSVSAFTVTANSGQRVQVSATAPGNGQIVEYAMNTVDSAPVDGWITFDEYNIPFTGTSSDPTFGAWNNLTTLTKYYFFARAKGNDVYKAGPVVGTSAVVTDGVYFEDPDGNFYHLPASSTVTITVAAGSIITFTAVQPYDSIMFWTLNGTMTNNSTNQYTFDTTGRGPGTYQVVLMALKNGVPYSPAVKVTIQ